MYHIKCFTIFICIELYLPYLIIIVVISFMFHKGHQGIDGLPRGMKNDPIQFSIFPYYEHREITHLFDTMYISNNVT
jgi:hypothetical protein